MSDLPNYYKVLRLDELCKNPSAIKKAYHLLAKEFHPDVNKSDSATARFKEISHAYEVLSDDRKRALYEVKFQTFIGQQDLLNESAKYRENFENSFRNTDHSKQYKRRSKLTTPLVAPLRGAYDNRCMKLTTSQSSLLYYLQHRQQC